MNGDVGLQLVQLAGALLILGAFIANQRKRLSSDARAYLALNFAGSLVLAVVAAVNRDFGFLLLEGVWAIVSGYGLVRVTRPSGGA